MALKVFHLFANTRNLGDFGSAEGIKQMFRQAFVDVYFEDFHLSFGDLPSQLIKKINQNFDLVVLGGGGLYRPGSENLILRLSKHSLQLINKPIIAYSIGLNQEEYLLYDHKKFNEQIKEINRYFFLNSVRDQMTQRKLSDLGVSAQLVPCPSALLEPAKENFDIIVNGKENVGLVLVPRNRLSPFVADNYFHCILDLIEKYRENYNFYFISHGFNIEDVYYEINKSAEIKLIYSANPAQLMRCYLQMSFLVGSRGHMAIFATGALRPFINISYNVKCDAFVEMIDYPVQFSKNIAGLNRHDLFAAFESMVEQKDSIKDQLLEKKNNFLALNNSFVNDIKKIIV